MSTSVTKRRAAAGAVALILTASTTAGAGEDRTFALAISGAHTMSFTGKCVVEQADRKFTLELSGSPPAAYTLSGRGVSCSIMVTGRGGIITVEIIGDDGRLISRSSSTGGTTIVISVHS